MTEPSSPTAEQSDWLARIEAGGGRAALPGWLDLGRLPTLRWQDGPPTTTTSEKLVRWLRRELRDGPSVAVAAVGLLLNAADRASFAGELLAQAAAGSPAQQPWVTELAVAWGDDTTTSQLAELVRGFSTSRKPQRAQRGAEALARIGSELALLHLQQLAVAARTPSVRHRAAELFAEAAQARGLTADRLADRLAPNLGFSRTGVLAIGFGTRSWSARLTPRLTVEVVDPRGKVLKGVPRPGKGDDRASAAASLARLRHAKNELKTFHFVHVHRLETAMLSRRRWPNSEWRALHLEHPIMRLLAQTIVWEACGPGGERRIFFRVAEDWSAADVCDEAVDPALLAPLAIGVVHPLHMTADEIARWSATFADYEIGQHFEQLARCTFTPTEEELRAGSVGRYLGWMVDARQLLYHLPPRGWQAAAPVEFGLVIAHTRILEWADVTAVLHHGPILPGQPRVTMETALGELAFVRGRLERLEPWAAKSLGRVPIGAVDRIAFSEALRDVDHLARSGRGYDPDWRRRIAGRP
jgi:hypothetical protein